jgi:hypothetical protein
MQRFSVAKIFHTGGSRQAHNLRPAALLDPPVGAVDRGANLERLARACDRFLHESSTNPYEAFARTLQTEFEEDFGIKFGRVEKIAFAGLVQRAPDGSEKELGQDTSVKLWASSLQRVISIHPAKFDPKNPHFKLEVSDEVAALAPEIIDEVNRKLSKNRSGGWSRAGSYYSGTLICRKRPTAEV